MKITPLTVISDGTEPTQTYSPELLRQALALQQAPQREVFRLLHRLLIAAEGVKQSGECWCSAAGRIRDFDGKHSPQCQYMQDVVGEISNFGK